MSKPFTNAKQRKTREQRIQSKQDKRKNALAKELINSRDPNYFTKRAKQPQVVAEIATAAMVAGKVAGAVASGAQILKAGKGAYNALKRVFSTAEEGYLYGFIDPENAAPGPGDGTSTTYVVKHRSYSDVTLEVLPHRAETGVNFLATAGALANSNSPAYFNGAPNDPFFSSGTVYVATAGAPLTFVCMPHALRSTLGNLTPQNVWNYYVAGAIIDAGTTNESPMYSSEAIYAVPSPGAVIVPQQFLNWQIPMEGFDIEPFYTPPRDRKFTAYDALWNPTTEFVSMSQLVRMRTVGLKLEVECNFPALTTAGQVVGGDNRNIYGQQQEVWRHDTFHTQNQLSTNATSSAGMVFNDLLPPGEPVATGDGWSQSRRDCGALSHGAVYEAQHIPSGDHMLQWTTNPAPSAAAYFSNTPNSVSPVGDSPDAARNNVMTWADALMNNPMCYLTITGAPTGCTFRTRCTWAVEYTVTNEGPLALVREAARFNARFVPDWGAIAMCCTAGKGVGSCCVKAASCCPKMLRGAQGALGIMPRQAGRPANTENYAIGAHSVAPILAARIGPAVRNTAQATPITPQIAVTGGPPPATPAHRPDESFLHMMRTSPANRRHEIKAGLYNRYGGLLDNLDLNAKDDPWNPYQP